MNANIQNIVNELYVLAAQYMTAVESGLLSDFHIRLLVRKASIRLQMAEHLKATYGRRLQLRGPLQ